MAEKLRSPNYPAMGLGTAIDRARLLYKQDGKSAVPVDGAVRAWGYTSLNGRSLRALGALKGYGLIEYVAPKMVKLSSRALIILMEPDESEARRKAILAAAFEPPMFAQLHEQYGDDLPSDQSMIASLVRGNFIEDAATKLVSAYRETVALTLAGGIADTSRHENSSGQRSTEENRDQSTSRWKTQEKSMPDLAGQDARPYDLTLALMDGVQATLRIPRQMSADNYTLLTTLLDANLKAMKKALVKDAAVSDPGQVV